MSGYIILMLVFVVLSAFFSATETAYSSLNRAKLKAMAEKGDKKANRALLIYDDYDKLISTVLIGNNIVNIALASVGTIFFVYFFEEAGVTVSTVIITVVVLIFGEITPKSIAKDCPEKFARFSAPLMRILMWLFTPLNFIFTNWKRFVSKVFGLKKDDKMSQEELLMLVDEVEQEGSIDTDEGELLRNVLEFKEQEAEDILTHRVDIEAVSVDASKEEIAETFSETSYSRLLVYKDNIDKIVGVIHLKDFYTSKGITGKKTEEIMTKPVFIQKSVKINDLLKILQKNKSHVAVVIDEYGGTLGIVTMEDILEELVGEIWDEHDEVTEDFVKLGERTYRVDGSVNFNDFCEFFKIEEESDSVSVGGWVTEKLKKIPEKSDKFDLGNIRIIVDEADAHRVLRVIVKCREENTRDKE